MSQSVLIPDLPGLRDVKAEKYYVKLDNGKGANDGAAIQAAVDCLPKREAGSKIYGGTV